MQCKNCGHEISYVVDCYLHINNKKLTRKCNFMEDKIDNKYKTMKQNGVNYDVKLICKCKNPEPIIEEVI